MTKTRLTITLASSGDQAINVILFLCQISIIPIERYGEFPYRVPSPLASSYSTSYTAYRGPLPTDP
jgi:hypothetical protein